VVSMSAGVTSMLAGLASPAAGDGSIPAKLDRKEVIGERVGVSGAGR
jgi:hypothetical protein